MQMSLQVFFYLLKNTLRRFNAGLSAVRNTEWAEKKIKTVPHMFDDSAEVYIRQ